MFDRSSEVKHTADTASTMVKERIAVNFRIAIVAITNTKVSANTYEVVDI